MKVDGIVGGRAEEIGMEFERCLEPGCVLAEHSQRVAHQLDDGRLLHRANCDEAHKHSAPVCCVDDCPACMARRGE
jgi:hypothetical protein